MHAILLLLYKDKETISDKSSIQIKHKKNEYKKTNDNQKVRSKIEGKKNKNKLIQVEMILEL